MAAVKPSSMDFCCSSPLWQRTKEQSSITSEIKTNRKQRANAGKTSLHLLHGEEVSVPQKRFSNQFEVTILSTFLQIQLKSSS